MHPKDYECICNEVITDISILPADISDLVKSHDFPVIIKERLEALVSHNKEGLDNYAVSTAATTPLMSFNIFAFAVGNFFRINASQTYKDRPVTFVCLTEKQEELKANFNRLDKLTQHGLEFFE